MDIHRDVMCVSCFGDITSTAVLLCMVVHPAARIFRAVPFVHSYQYLAARILPDVLIDYSMYILLCGHLPLGNVYYILP